MADNLSSVGLLLAGATSISNVIKDVGAKKVVDHHEVVASTFWIRLFAALAFGLALISRVVMFGAAPDFRDGGAIFGISALHFSPVPSWLIYLTVEVILVACSTLLYFRALQVSPISLCMPYIAFTPVFLIPTGYWINNELPARQNLIGVALIFIGSIVIHRQLFSAGWLEPVKAIWRERGCFYMLLVGFINSITNPIDAKLVRMTDAFTQACAFGIGMVVFFSLLALARRADLGKVIRAVPFWVVLAGTLEAVALIFQLSSHNYIAVAITISIKRAGIILIVLLGWLVFKERDIGDKLIAASVMLAGALVFYLRLSLPQGIGLAVVALAAGKHVLLQKPVAARLAEAEAAAQAHERGIISGLYLSYFDQPLMHDLQAMVRGGWFGEVTHLYARLMHGGGLALSQQIQAGETNWRASVAQTGGGCFIQLAVHYVHLFNWLLNARVARVMAMTKNRHCPGVEGEDLACALLEFDNGALATLDLAWCSAGEQLAIHGTRGTAQYTGNQTLLLDSSAGAFAGHVIDYRFPK